MKKNKGRTEESVPDVVGDGLKINEVRDARVGIVLEFRCEKHGVFQTQVYKLGNTVVLPEKCPAGCTTIKAVVAKVEFPKDVKGQ